MPIFLPEMLKAIEVENLFVQYRSRSGVVKDAVKGLSFQVDRGEVVAFLGPNGAGKSSTLKALMGFLIPASGAVSVFGLEAGSIEAKRRIGYLPEIANYYPYLTPTETLCLYGNLQGLQGQSLRREVAELLEQVGLASASKTLNKNLSKGMLQRVGIAQALLGEPELLILDEFTSGLDPIGRRQLRDLLQKRRDAGCTIFFSSHELDEVEMLCDRVLLIRDGKLIDENAVEALKENLGSYSLTYRGKQFEAPGVCEQLSKQIWRHTFADKGEFMQTLNQTFKHKVELLDVSCSDGSLEDYFVDTIRRSA
ncbi:MAG: ABC transporter ATP-binding protein [Armatimonadetes bacterium]|nr:ABC transporter ATP-binding protein [Armatimonadota bacterium]